MLAWHVGEQYGRVGFIGLRCAPKSKTTQRTMVTLSVGREGRLGAGALENSDWIYGSILRGEKFDFRGLSYVIQTGRTGMDLA